MLDGGPERTDVQGSLYKIIYDERAGLRGGRFDRVVDHTDRAGEAHNIYCKPAASDMAEPAYYVVGVPNTVRVPRG